MWLFTADPTLARRIRRLGRMDSSACLQCGACTLRCDLASDAAAFPRATIRYALLGLNEPLDASLDPWLCQYCGDCSEGCPQGAEPGEAMMTLRRYLVGRYDWTGLASRIQRSRAWAVGSLLVAAAVVLVLAVVYHLLEADTSWGELTDPEWAADMGLEHVFPLMTDFTRVVITIPIVFLLLGAARMVWLTTRGPDAPKAPLHLYATTAGVFLWQGLSQSRLRECLGRRYWIGHLLLASSCLAMVAILWFGLEWFQTDALYPLAHPQRWVGYLLTAGMVGPVVWVLAGRVRKRRQVHRFSRAPDLTLPILLLLTALTGIAIHVLRYQAALEAAHYMYVVHLLVSVPLLVVEIPFGKGAHMLYRPLALYLHAVRERARQRRPAGDVEAVTSHAR